MICIGHNNRLPVSPNSERDRAPRDKSFGSLFMDMEKMDNCDSVAVAWKLRLRRKLFFAVYAAKRPHRRLNEPERKEKFQINVSSFNFHASFKYIAQKIAKYADRSHHWYITTKLYFARASSMEILLPIHLVL